MLLISGLVQREGEHEGARDAPGRLRISFVELSLLLLPQSTLTPTPHTRDHPTTKVVSLVVREAPTRVHAYSRPLPIRGGQTTSMSMSKSNVTADEKLHEVPMGLELPLSCPPSLARSLPLIHLSRREGGPTSEVAVVTYCNYR